MGGKEGTNVTFELLFSSAHMCRQLTTHLQKQILEELFENVPDVTNIMDVQPPLQHTEPSAMPRRPPEMDAEILESLLWVLVKPV